MFPFLSLVIQSYFFSFVRAAALPNFLTWITCLSADIFNVTFHFWSKILNFHSSKKVKPGHLWIFSKWMFFRRLKRYNVIRNQNTCYVLQWNLIRRMMKLGTEFLWKLLLVQHLHAMFTWKQNIARVQFCEIKSQKKRFQGHVMSSNTSGNWSSKKYSPSGVFPLLFYLLPQIHSLGAASENNWSKWGA